MKRFVSLAFAVMLIFACTVGAYAESELVLYSSDYFSGYGVTLSNQGSAMIKIVFSADGAEICDEIGVATFEIEKYNEDNGAWENVSGLINGQTGSNTLSYTFSRYFQGVEDERYRVQVTFVSIIDNSAEYKTHTSGVITASRFRT